MEDAPGLRLQGRRRRDLGDQLHDPQPDRDRRTPGPDHLADRLGADDQPLARRHPPAEDAGLDVAGTPHVYPVFDAERGFDTDGDGNYTFPDEVPTDPSRPASRSAPTSAAPPSWTVPAGGRTLVWAVGHLHPGGLYMDMQVARDGPDAGSTAGRRPVGGRPLFRSDAHYYEPAGAVSWDVAMTATRPDWRVHLKAGDVVSVNATYDVRKASWYESMGLFPLEVSAVDDPAAKDPFDDDAAVKAMYDEGGILTHGRLRENIDKHANKNLKLPDPRDLRSDTNDLSRRDRDVHPAQGVDEPLAAWIPHP